MGVFFLPKIKERNDKMPAYKDKKRGTWYCSFYYADWNGQRKKKKKEGFKTKGKALEFERSFLEKSQASPDMTFGALVELYMEDCKSRLKPTTYENKQYVIGLKVLPYFKDMPINTIEPATVRQWQNKLLALDYKPTYLKTVHNQLSAILNFAMKYYKLPSNPARICGAMGKKNAEDIEFWTLDEFKQFIVHSDNVMYTLIYQLLFWTGMRIGECLALNLTDFDFEKRTVSINKNYARHQKQDLILEPKTPKSKRLITIPNFLCLMVKDYVDKLYDYESYERLFPIIKSTINAHMLRTVKKSDVKRIRVHDLRHSHASLLIEEGFSPLLISERLGHETIETTLQTYSHLYPNKHSEVADRLDTINNKIDTSEIEEKIK